LKKKRETAETDRETDRHDLAAMPRKYRKTCRNDGFGLYPANRRYQANCRQQVAQPATGKAEGKQRFMRCRRKADRRSGGAVTEPPGYLVKPSG